VTEDSPVIDHFSIGSDDRAAVTIRSQHDTIAAEINAAQRESSSHFCSVSFCSVPDSENLLQERGETTKKSMLDDELKPIRHYYLGDQSAIEAAMQAVANQGKAK